jgi:catechol 2,3-dioxygenase-like lactoylglutathione lyase family enzyme
MATTQRINFVSIPVDDQDRAIAFYRDRLGFELQLDAPYEDGWRWVFMTLPGAETRLHFARKNDEVTWRADIPVVALVCDDVDAYSDDLLAAGVTIHDGPGDAPWAQGVRWLLIRDSEDNLLLLESLQK